jgi:H+-transporting ATPase
MPCVTFLLSYLLHLLVLQMITGDHLNIAKETARLIGMGVNIHAGEETRNPTQERNQLIWESDGFAQVLPRDKREVVLVLKDIYKIVVGMTGDGEHL